MLGKIVTVKVDRPINSVHPKHKDIIYNVNYGYVEGIISNVDNEELDAYILGINEPVKEFTGKVIAIIKRIGDEEKLIVSNRYYSKEEILKEVNFQEKYFKSTIETLYTTTEDIIYDLKMSGIKPNDNILIHSSLKSFGNIKGEIIIEALTTYITEGLIVFPTHSWATMKQDNQVFDLKNTPSCVGTLTNIAMNTEGFKRSSHPTHSVCAYGNDKDEYLALDNNVNTPVNPNGCFGKVLSDKRFKLLFMGAPLSKITFVHSIEEEFDVEDRFTDHIYRFISKDGNKKRIYNMPKHFSTKNPHLSEHYEKLLGPMLNMEIAKECYIGNSKTHIIDAYKCREYVYKLLEDDIHVFDDYREVKEI